MLVNKLTILQIEIIGLIMGNFEPTNQDLINVTELFWANECLHLLEASPLASKQSVFVGGGTEQKTRLKPSENFNFDIPLPENISKAISYLSK